VLGSFFQGCGQGFFGRAVARVPALCVVLLADSVALPGMLVRAPHSLKFLLSHLSGHNVG